MEQRTHTYYAAYPVPSSTDGRRVSYTLPAVQSGAYDGKLDIMLADPASGGPLTEADSPGFALAFAHKCHILRIQVPEGRNLFGEPIARLRIEFPSEVVGTLTWDVTAPDAEPVFTGGSNTVTLDLRRPLDESAEDAPDGNYAWVFLRGGATVDGEVTFHAYNSDGHRSHTISTTLNKTLQAGAITPLTLTLPRKQIVRMNFSVARNNLGEALTDIHLTAPAGTFFTDGTTAKTFSPTDNGFPAVEMFYTDPLPGASLGIDYESENALLTNRTLGIPSRFDEYAPLAMPLTVPYLYEDSFDTVAGNDSHADDKGDAASWLDAAGLPGWSGTKWKTHANTSLEVRTYIGSSTALGRQDNRYGRLDSPSLPLKQGKSVRTTIRYTIGSTTDSNNGYTKCVFGTSTDAGAIAGGYGWGNEKRPSNQLDYYRPSTGGTPSNTPDAKTNTADNCTAATRLTWLIDYDKKSGAFVTVTAATFYVYIDNIQVQITK